MPLVALPYEVLELVCDLLTTPQLCSLREACRRCDVVASKLLWRRLVVDLSKSGKRIPGRNTRITRLSHLMGCLDKLPLVRDIHCMFDDDSVDSGVFDAAVVSGRLTGLRSIHYTYRGSTESNAYAWVGQVTRRSPNAVLYADLTLIAPDFNTISKSDGSSKPDQWSKLDGSSLTELRVELSGTEGKVNFITALFDPVPHRLAKISVKCSAPICDWNSIFSSANELRQIELEFRGDYDTAVLPPARSVAIAKYPTATIALKSTGPIKELTIGHIATSDNRRSLKNRAPLGRFIATHKSSLEYLNVSSLQRGEFIWHELFCDVFPCLRTLSISCLLWQGMRRKGASFPSLIELNITYFACRREAVFYIPECNVLPEPLVEDLLLDFIPGSPNLRDVLLFVEPEIHLVTPSRMSWVTQLGQSCYKVDCLKLQQQSTIIWSE
ncbi:hypothetical protein TRVA0_010S02850 [Trichomonascus vanleenenianus]|uniref:F-box protein n=1 Tax=Trichomonascus vanleenenianus TaxID=2268995 RepID=UPI003ECA0F9A